MPLDEDEDKDHGDSANKEEEQDDKIDANSKRNSDLDFMSEDGELVKKKSKENDSWDFDDDDLGEDQDIFAVNNTKQASAVKQVEEVVEESPE